jgi:hypothetical protein
MRLRAILGIAALALLTFAGCGGASSKETSIPGGADADSVQVIKDWADDLRAGDIPAAADHFVVPSVVQNGTPLIQLANRNQVIQFNRSLPCGAELTRAEQRGRFVIATFRLTERPGPGTCGAGVGETAQTAFVIEDGHIRQWRRVAVAPGGGGGQPAPQGPVV